MSSVGTALRLFSVLRTCVNDPPNVKLWLPFSQLTLSSMFQFGVLRGALSVRVKGSVTSGKFSANPP